VGPSWVARATGAARLKIARGLDADFANRKWFVDRRAEPATHAPAIAGGRHRKAHLMMGIGFLIALGPGVALFLGYFLLWLGARHHFRHEDLHTYEDEHGHLPAA
jgi:hypothetical protein